MTALLLVAATALDAAEPPRREVFSEVWATVRDQFFDLDLFNCRLPSMTSRGRDGRETSDARCWSKPVVLLVDGQTRRGKELFAYGFRKYGYGKVVGTQLERAAEVLVHELARPGR